MSKNITDYHMNPQPTTGEFNPEAIFILLVVGLIFLVVLIFLLWREGLLAKDPYPKEQKKGSQ